MKFPCKPHRRNKKKVSYGTRQRENFNSAKRGQSENKGGPAKLAPDGSLSFFLLLANLENPKISPEPKKQPKPSS